MVTPDAALGQIAASVASPSLTSFVEVLPRSIESTQFLSAAITGLLHDHGIAISMDGKGCWRDNIFVERL